MRLSKTLIERIKAEAVAAQKPPSHLLEELVWKALNRSVTIDALTDLDTGKTSRAQAKE